MNNPRFGLFLLVLVAGAFPACQYPSKGDVERFSQSYKKLPAEQRADAAERFLVKLKSPASVTDDKVLDHAMQEFGNLYQSTRDEQLLEAMDAVRIDGGFAMELCGIYKRFSAEPEMRQRYRGGRGQRASLWRCQGLSFSREELSAFFEEAPMKGK